MQTMARGMVLRKEATPRFRAVAFRNLNKRTFVERIKGKPFFVDNKAKQEIIDRLQSTRLVFQKLDRPEFLTPFDEKTALVQSIPIKKKK